MTGGRKKKERAGQNTKQMCRENASRRRNGHQTKQRSHGNKSISAADQGQVDKRLKGVSIRESILNTGHARFEA